MADSSRTLISGGKEVAIDVFDGTIDSGEGEWLGLILGARAKTWRPVLGCSEVGPRAPSTPPHRLSFICDRKDFDDRLRLR